MEENSSAAGGKLTGIRQIVRLKEILQKWQSVTLNPKADGSCSTSQLDHETTVTPGISIPRILNKRLEQVRACDSDEESIHSPTDPPPDVPKGYLAVYVGEELRRFVIPTGYLKHSLFKVLLEKVEEEFGFDHSGGLTIPCEIETFKYLLKCMENQNNAEDGPDDESSADNSEATEE
ncbi:uncharacterized protein LOC116187086 [Punica granatum]|uniref:Uncharacterized protein LOC116187086 n=2 Tax=Punica granatum TaxID=22663 RepID=A0A6P8BMS8_PUNGR|nr:uncharacterized protein LOC116187086 [Punica granatum]XP_031371539.1 uncharacterized protein LOC116187086 [Punica granatum]OWM84065.1 hypothetical protein CDL15_Pgr009312 [Punica granatum]PKI76041.1 hypothetical protein CRG98_003591 [Punica granatum]